MASTWRRRLWNVSGSSSRRTFPTSKKAQRTIPLPHGSGPDKVGSTRTDATRHDTTGRATPMDLLTTFAGSMMEGFLPRGWDLARIDACCAHPPESIKERRPWWHSAFEPVACASVDDFDVMLRHEIARTIQRIRVQGCPAALILPVGPMGMYRWAVYFLKEWDVQCDHVFGFNMDEWSDREGKTLPAHHPGAFQNAM